MLVLWRIVAIWSWDVVKIYAALVIAIMIIPPIVLSFIVTRYRGGHPRYEFDLDIKFSGRKEIEKRRELLREKKIGLLLTPEEFAAINKKKRHG